MATYPFNVSYIFLGILCKIQFNDDDPSHHDQHQEGQNDQEPELWPGLGLVRCGTNHVP